MEDRMSKLQLFSVGIVAANKGLNTNIIEVTPIEDLPMINGEITSHGVEYKSKGADSSGAVYESNIKSSNTLKATWMPIGNGNRFTSPDVRRGEYVMLYQYADADKYFWVTFKDDLKLRKLETVIYAFSGTQNEASGVTGETHYFLEISTHKKLVTFHTSKANGEPFAYDVQFNTGEGYIVIQDDIGNVFCLNSKERRIDIKNTDNTHLDIEKKNFTVTVPGDSTINTTGNTVINSGGNANVKTGGTSTITSAKNIINGPTEINGPLVLKGPFSHKGSGGGAGAQMTISGTMTVEHIVTTTRIDAPGINGPATSIG